MSDNASASGSDESRKEASNQAQNARLQKAVIVALRAGQPPRVLAEAARYAGLLQVPLVVVHVDVTRFVTFEDPDGIVHSAPIDLNIDTGAEEFAEVQADTEKALAGSGLTWTARQLVGDPALAIKHLSEELDAQLIVVGTRSRGLGESIREFFTGSVAARLSHRQSRPILVVPLEEPVADDKKDPWAE
jgi:nucleotide-binding universal stress UspA family protein